MADEHMTRIGSGFYLTPSDAAMTREHLTSYLRERGTSDADLEYFLNEYAGKTEAEMDEVYSEICGPMA